MKIEHCWRFAGVIGLLLGLLSVPTGYGQTVVGRIDGTVTDASGQVIAKAEVVLKSTDTATVRHATTSESGTYVIPSVPVGLYSLTVTESGFQTYVQSDIQLQVDQSLTIDAQLKVGSTSQTVEVKSSTDALDQTDATVGDVIQQQEIVDIPLNGRNFTQLILLTAGASPVQTGQQSLFTITGGVSPAMNGMRAQMNNFTLDGVDNNMRFTNTYAQSPPPDAIAEFKVEQHQTEASAAFAAGANINLVTKGGSNALHGSAWEFVRNNDFTARNYFDNYFDSPTLPFHQNQFGYFLGGPVVIPHVIDGRKTGTYFSTYFERFRLLRNVTTDGTVPDQAERGGDFSELLGPVVGTDCLGRPVQQGELYDPLTTVTNASCPGGVVRDPFPNNVIPSNRIQGVAQAYLQFLYPQPNAPGAENLVLSQRVNQTADQYGVRIDQNITEKATLFARISSYNNNLLSPGTLPANVFQQVNSGLNAAGHYTQVFSPTFLMDILFGYNRSTIPYRYKPLSSAFDSAVGPNFYITLPAGNIPAAINLGGSQFTSASFFDYDLANPDSSYQGNVDLRKVKGKHEVVWGVHYMFYRHFTALQGGLDLGFTSDISGLPGFGTTGQSLASFYLGYPNNNDYNFAIPLNHYSNIYNLYVGDTWKVTPRLTVNYGLQYVYAAPPIVVHNTISLFDYPLALTQPDATDFSFAYLWCATNPITGQAPNCPGKSLFTPDRNNFAPRIGIAYSPFQKTVFRLGFGTFYDYNTNINQNSVNITQSVWPFTRSSVITGQNTTTLGPLNPVLSLANPFPVQTQGPPTPRFSIDRFVRDPYAMEWNVGIERMLPAEIKLSVNYVGSAGRKLPIQTDENIAPAGLGPFEDRRPLLNVGSFTYDQNEGTSSYNSLQATIEKTISSTLGFRNSYTYSKSEDIESDANGGLRAPAYTYDRRLSWGPSDFDITNLDVTSFMYHPSIGRGGRFASNISRPLDALIGHWELSGILTFRSGTPFSVVDGVDQANTGAGSAAHQTPDQVSNPDASGFVRNQKHWFNPAAFQLPAFGSLGDTGSNSLRSPSFTDLDFAILKNIPLKERLNLQLRVETFNLFNHTNFEAPNATLTAASTFGEILAAYPARDMQFGIKLIW